MPIPLRVLMVEDSENDASLLLWQLRKAGYAVEFERVENAAEMQAALEKNDWDIIMADYALPQFDAPSALALLQKSGLDIPIIVISGEISEERAVALMKAGAQDYLMKGHLARLAPVLERELTQAHKRKEHRAAEEKLHNTLQQLNFHIENTPLAVVQFDNELKITYWSGKARGMFGWKAEEVLGKQIDQFRWFHEQDAIRVAAQRADMLASRKTNTVHTNRNYRKNGSVITCQWYNSALFDSQNKLISLQSQVLDISEQVHAEEALRESEEKFRLLVEHSPIGILIVNQRGLIIGWNRAQEIIFGLKKAEALGRPSWDIQCKFLPESGRTPDALQRYKNMILNILKTGESPDMNQVREYMIHCPDGRQAWIETNAFVVKTVDGYVSVTSSSDITERKQAEETLNRRNAEINLLYQASQELGRTLDFDSLFHTLYQQISKMMACDGFFIASYDEQQQMICCVYGNLEKQRQDVSGFPLIPLEPEGQGTQSRVIRSGQSWMLNDYQAEVKKSKTLYYINPEGEIATSLGNAPRNDMPEGVESVVDVSEDGDITRSAIIVPLLFKGKVLGNIQVSSYRLNAYSQENLNIAEALAAQFAIAYNNAALYRDAQLEIAERKRIQDELRESNERFSNAFEFAPNGMTLTLVDGRWLKVNRALCEMLGYSEQELLRMNYQDITHPDDLAADLVFNWKLLSGEIDGYQQLQKRYLHKTGQLVWVLLNISVVCDEMGQPLYFISQVTNITERKRVEDELRLAHVELEQRVMERTADLQVANMALEKAARLKDEFLASMSHELRTPLTGILGLSEALQMVTYGDLNEKQRSALKNIQSSGKHLLSLINDMLDLSKIEAGRFDLQIEACSLGDICQSSLQLTRGMANQKHQKISFSMEPAAIILKADARRLKQMLVNLLGNAIKFSPEDGKLGIEVKGSRVEQQLYITVWDEGIGIRDEDLPRLFQPFVQLDSGLSRQYAGTGLGLSLVQRLAHLHNGGIEVESEFGKGSRFTLVLPWQENFINNLTTQQQSAVLEHKTGPVTNAMTLKANSLQQGPLVLMADDNEIVLELVSDFLVSRNYRVSVTRNGIEFLERLEQVMADIILMDIQMPGMDGIEVIRRIRAHPLERTAALPVIAVTALAMAGDHERCLAAGANAYFSKPVELKELVKTIEELCRV